MKDASRELGVDYLDHTHAALFVDLDSDGGQDLVLAVARGILLPENSGAGGFLQKALLPRVTGCFSLAFADYDGNGTVDFFHAQRNPDAAAVSSALAHATKANGLTHQGNAALPDTLARARIAAGRQSDALATVRTALTLKGTVPEIAQGLEELQRTLTP